MKGLTKIAVFTLLLTCLLSCKKTELTGNYSRYVGTWKWEYTDLGQGGVETPSSTGYTLTLELESKGKYKLYKNGKKIEYGRLQEDNGNLKFVRDDLFNHKDDLMNGNKIFDSSIRRSNVTEIEIGVALCCDNRIYAFIKS